jgi:hypothetical protein
MRLTRLLAIALASIGVGLVSGAVTQVAALDGKLEQAAKSDSPPPYLQVDERTPPPDPRCHHRHLRRSLTTTGAT